jgi:glycosyltransferase involved in cell wall biosynthesis
VTGVLPRIDLVVGTRGRGPELERLLRSVVAQDYPGVRVLVVDQNEEGTLDELLEGLAGSLELIHLRSERPGVNRARNVGLAAASAEVIGIPDDDSWLPGGLLRTIGGRFAASPGLGGLTVMLVDEARRPSNGRWDRRAGPVTRGNVWGRGVGSGIFLRREAFQAVGPLDETLGPGSGMWAAGDETDLLIRVLDAGFRVEYEPALHVFHPDPWRDSQDAYPLERWRAYAAAMGYLMRKHGYPFHSVLYRCARPLGGSALDALRGDLPRARVRLAVAAARARGWAMSAAR